MIIHWRKLVIDIMTQLNEGCIQKTNTTKHEFLQILAYQTYFQLNKIDQKGVVRYQVETILSIN